MRLHGVQRNADDPRHGLDRLFLVIDEIEDFAMAARFESLQPSEMSAEERVAEVVAILATGTLRIRRDIADPAMKKLVILAADSFSTNSR